MEKGGDFEPESGPDTQEEPWKLRALNGAAVAEPAGSG